MNKPIAQLGPSTDRTAKTIYILYLVGLVFGITSIIGIVMAYLNQNDSPEWLKSHYRFQIIRCIKGLKLIEQQQEYPNPTTWLF